MRRSLVAGNWKMNGTLESVRALTSGILAEFDKLAAIDVAVCPPSIFIPAVSALAAGGGLALGAQDISEYEAGAYTGEVSGAMLNDYNCKYTIIGHSERRHVFGESDDRVSAKFSMAHAAGIHPIVCVGELIEQRRAGTTEAVVGAQLDAVLDVADVESLRQTTIAYEPVWAIGTGETATPEQAQAVHEFIRARVAARDQATAANMRLLYGGSVKPDNAAELFAMPDVDGGLIGGAALNAGDFLAICNAAVMMAAGD